MVNQGTILGRVGKIDTKTAGNGTVITNISMVTSKKYIKDGEKQEKVTWHNVTLFNKLAEIAQKYVAIGDKLYVQGEMANQKYTTADGQERTKYFLIGNDMQLLSSPKETKVAPQAAAAQAPAFEDDDVPW